MAKQDDYVRYTIRVPAELYERVKEAAGDKSVNAEIISRLEASFAPNLALTSAESQSIVKVLNDILDARGVPRIPPDDSTPG